MLFQSLRTGILYALFLLLSGCTSDNEHFCTRYEYLYQQLSDKDLLPYSELKPLLIKEIQVKGARDKRPEMMLLALEDHYLELVQEGESPKDFCMRNKRWLR